MDDIDDYIEAMKEGEAYQSDEKNRQKVIREAVGELGSTVKEKQKAIREKSGKRPFEITGHNADQFTLMNKEYHLKVSYNTKAPEEIIIEHKGSCMKIKPENGNWIGRWEEDSNDDDEKEVPFGDVDGIARNLIMGTIKKNFFEAF